MFVLRGRVPEILFFFLLTFLLSLLLSHTISSQGVQVFEEEESPWHAVYLFSSVLLFTLLLLLLIRFLPFLLPYLLLLLELLISFTSLLLLTSLVLPPLLSLLLSSALTLLYPLFRNRKIVKNLFSSVGGGVAAGVIGGGLGLLPSLLFALILSIYDILAVFVTRHMVVLAEAVGGRKGGGDEVMLGMGDVVVPSLLASSVLHSLAPPFSLPVLLGSLIGLLLNICLLHRYRIPLPALPLIFSCSVILLAVSLFLKTLLPL